MHRGKALSVSQGNYIGSIPPYGYNKIWITEGKRKCPVLTINEEEANVVRMIFDMYVNQDMGRALICRRLEQLGIKPAKGKTWSPATIKDLLDNVHYLGKIKWNYRKTVTIIEDGEIKKTSPKSKIGEYLIYDGKHEAIISEELFNAALEKRGKNTRARPDTVVRNPFASIMYCKCGYAMVLHPYTQTSRTPRLKCSDQVHCSTGSCTLDAVVEIVADVLKQCIADFEIRVKNDNGDSAKLHEKLLKSLEKKMQELEAKELAQWEAQANPDPSQRMPAHIFAVLNEKLLKEKEEVKEAMCNARNSMPEPVDYQKKLYRFKEALDTLLDPDADALLKNKLLKDCIERIEYHRERSERIRNTEKRTKNNGRIDGKGRSLKPNPLKTGANWTNPPIEIDVKLKV